nr:hypothetical protein [Tanacetum cinerariifolium]
MGQHKELNPQLTLLWMIKRMHPNRGEITKLDAEKEMDVDVQGRLEESQAKVYHLDIEHAKKVLITTAATTITAAQVPKASALRRRKGVHDLEETATPSVIMHSKVKSKDKGKGILVEEPKPLEIQEQIEGKLIQKLLVNQKCMGYLVRAYYNISSIKYYKDESFWNANVKSKTTEDIISNRSFMEVLVLNHYVLVKNVLGKLIQKLLLNQRCMGYLVHAYYSISSTKYYKDESFWNADVKSKTIEDIISNRSFMEVLVLNHYVLVKNVLDNKIKEEGSKTKSDSPEQKVVKKQRINEVEKEIKIHLQIVVDDDDMYTEATPLALKVHVVDYQIHHEHNKPYYKIIKADGTHQHFLSFITLVHNFDKEDLEMLWKLVQERFQSFEPKNFPDDFLLNNLKIMFEKPNVEASI